MAKLNEEELAYGAKFIKALTKVENQLYKSMKLEKLRFAVSAANYYQAAPYHFNILPLMPEHIVKVRNILIQHIRVVIPLFSAFTIETTNVKKELKQEPAYIFEDLVNRWIAENGLQKSILIAETSKQDALEIIQKGKEEGKSSEQIALDLRTKLPELAAFRAATIARTESHNAANFAQLETANDIQRDLRVKLVKKWLATQDGRTRDAHAAMIDHKEIALDDLFNVGLDRMARPGDPRGSASNIINCRCTLIFKKYEVETLA